MVRCCFILFAGPVRTDDHYYFGSCTVFDVLFLFTVPIGADRLAQRCAELQKQCAQENEEFFVEMPDEEEHLAATWMF